MHTICPPFPTFAPGIILASRATVAVRLSGIATAARGREALPEQPLQTCLLTMGSQHGCVALFQHTGD
jgi:hypothetical protein